MFVKVGRVEDVSPGRTLLVRAGETPVVLANHQGRIYALYGLCSHRGNPLEGAVLWDHLIECPYHHFQYNVRTGENQFPSNVYPADMPQLHEQVRPLRPYKVELREGEIWVDLG